MNLQEANSIGNIDKIYAQINKARTTINKAQNALLDVADELTDIILSANQIGGRVSVLIPSHLSPHIAAITRMADTDLQNILEGQGQSSLTALKNLLDVIPYRELKAQDTSDVRNQISLRPNFANGPQSAITEGYKNVEDFYKSVLMEQARNSYDDSSLNFDKLKESKVFGEVKDPNLVYTLMGSGIDKGIMQEQIRERINSDQHEATVLKENTSSNGVLDFKNIVPMGDTPGMTLDFSSEGPAFNAVN